MDLKLAEYKDGKFLRYVELAKNRPTLTPEFLLAKDFIYIKRLNVGDCELIEKDKTDPLKRFNGLFDGRTYGEGRFVLCLGLQYKTEMIWQDTILKDIQYSSPYYSLIRFDKVDQEIEIINVLGFIQDQEHTSIKKLLEPNCFIDDKEPEKTIVSVLGNLHQSPQLFKKLNND